MEMEEKSTDISLILPNKYWRKIWVYLINAAAKSEIRFNYQS